MAPTMTDTERLDFLECYVRHGCDMNKVRAEYDNMKQTTAGERLKAIHKSCAKRRAQGSGEGSGSDKAKAKGDNKKTGGAAKGKGGGKAKAPASKKRKLEVKDEEDDEDGSVGEVNGMEGFDDDEA